jgi:electron transfer flavoprotein beta subunit
MKIAVLVKLVPDLVEELEINEDGTALDMEWLRLIINEFDDHALEQAILLKENTGASVVVVSPEMDGVEDILFTAISKGADQVIKLMGDFEENVSSHGLARALAPVMRDLQPDLILTGVQANNDLDGAVGPLLSEFLGFPYVGYVSGMHLVEGKATVNKEYPGGLVAEMDITLPAVIGIQSAEQPPRYVAISKVRQAMKTAEIEEVDIDELDNLGGPVVEKMYQPESGERATMLEGGEEEVAEKLVKIFKEIGVM